MFRCSGPDHFNGLIITPQLSITEKNTYFEAFWVSLLFFFILNASAEFECSLQLQSRFSPCGGEGWGLQADKDNPLLQNVCVQTLITTPGIID